MYNTDVANTIPSKKSGVIYAENDKNHYLGFSNIKISETGKSIMSVNYYDESGTKNVFDFIANNKNVQGNKKITDMYIDYTVSPWELVIEVYIDGRLYTKRFVSK